ncbi:putative alpha/beta hydrolase-1 [Helianthus annuus]|uniref:Alpha/beta hydrolase-1 n=2 Tax=Helianthus annuus TaxID=4232 RepID=A0A251SS34_HELAN|nr:putative alpha/beta hydrolase-1 [Helianthus annuus]KAJ0849125.1 putative alpha/beta hydrolase-1 [Helianthus annuus]KAJ0858131.1 putative alpha/beta hydrolase-1 [Helianthus annuus]
MAKRHRPHHFFILKLTTINYLPWPIKFAPSVRTVDSLLSQSTTMSSSGILNIILVVIFVGFSAWAYQAARPPPPRPLGSPNGPVITSPRIKLRDGRHLAYEEFGVPKETAKSRIIFVHGFSSSKYFHPFATSASPELVKELGAYFVSLDRPGYGESDPDPKRTVKSLALDIEEFADQLNLGPRFYVVGFSMGGQIVWSCLKYIPHRLAGAVLISPAINFWWPNLPLNLTNEEYSRQLKRDQWALRVAHYLPWLTYWWNTQTWFPVFAVIHGHPTVLSPPDLKVFSKFLSVAEPGQLEILRTHPKQQGEFESLHRDMNIAFGKWEFDPMDIENPFPNNDGEVHLWMGDEDRVVPLALQRYIAKQVKWVNYHEVIGAGHTLPYADGVADDILKTLLKDQS